MVATPFAANLRHMVAVIWGRLGLMKGRAAFSMVATHPRGRLPVLTTTPPTPEIGAVCLERG